MPAIDPQRVPRGRWLLPLVLLAAAQLCGGCSTFDPQWEALRLSERKGETRATGILGRWIGQWRSETSEHKGRLRAIVSAPIDPAGNLASPPSPTAAGNGYDFQFSAVWGVDFESGYTITMTVRDEGGKLVFSGESDLGWPVGIYKCAGQIVGDKLHAKYEAMGDHGVFELRRP